MRQQTTDLDDGSVCKSSTESVPQLPPLGRNGGKQSKILAHDGVPKKGLLLCLQHTCRIGDRHGGRRLRTADSVAPAAGAGALVLKLGACGQTPHVSHATGIRRAYGGHNVRMHAARTALARGARDGHTRRIRQKRGACNCNGSSNVCNVSSNVPSRPFFGTACSHLPALAVVTKVGKANAPKHCAPASGTQTRRTVASGAMRRTSRSTPFAHAFADTHASPAREHHAEHFQPKQRYPPLTTASKSRTERGRAP